MSEMASDESPKKSWTLRLQRIPAAATAEFLTKDLQSITASSPDLKAAFATVKIRSVARTTDRYCTSTVIVRTRAKLADFLREFQEACEEHDCGYKLDNDFDGITPLTDGKKNVSCDIVAVSGLNSHPLGTWKARGRNDVWLRDWLPEDVPNARILIYGYGTNLKTTTARYSIESLSQNLLDALTAFRRATNTLDRPVVFIGHSLGGLLAKEALVQSLKISGSKFHKEKLHLACRGMVFFGVPHWGIRLECLKTIVEGQPNKALIETIVVDDQTEASHYLKRLSKDFAECFDGQSGVVSVFETHESRTVTEMPNGKLELKGELRLLVTEQSATQIGLTGRLREETIAFDTDHSDLVKFDSDTQTRYGIVRDRIADLVTAATQRPVQEAAITESQDVQDEAPKSHPAPITQKGPVISGSNTVGEGSTVNQGNGNSNNLTCHLR